jgi:hypothetical protein
MKEFADCAYLYPNGGFNNWKGEGITFSIGKRVIGIALWGSR